MLYALLAFALTLMLIGAALVITQFISIFTRAPYVPSSQARVRGMIALAELRPDELAVDLGSGDGRVVIAAARAGARAVGWEMNPLLVLWSRLAARLAKVGGRATFHWGNYRGRDFRDADVVFMYLLPSEMKRLERWLPEATRPGARLVAHAFPFISWTPERKDGSLYRYRLPISTSDVENYD